MAPKRKRDDNENNSNKKRKLKHTITRDWVPASKTRNYIIDDPLIDYLNMYGLSNNIKMECHSNLNFKDYILNKGHEFEDYIIEEIIDNFKEDFVEVERKLNYPSYIRYQKELDKTLNLMKNGIPIIYQGLIYNPNNQTYGYPDLIVRSDYLNQIVDCPVINENNLRRGCKFNKNWHYRIIDIKFTTLNFRANKSLLLNQKNTKPYKSQLFIYNEALNYFQNYLPRKAYILGRGWKTKYEFSDDPFDKLGVVDFKNEPEIKINTINAINWIKDLKKNGHTWTLDPPSRWELYPNMCNYLSSEWNEVKKQLAEKNSEITSIWFCGKKQRDIALQNNITRWDDPDCSSETLGLNGKYVPIIVDKILEINQPDNPNDYLVDLDTEFSLDWNRTDDCLAMYVDFENTSNINNIYSNDSVSAMIYMIGVSHFNKEKGLVYKNFTVNYLDITEEEKIMENFLNYLKDLQKKYNKKIFLYHYGFVEQTLFNKTINKHSIIPPLNLTWINLHKVIQESKLVIKGAFNFSLKTIIAALYKLKLIDCSYDGLEITNGSSAMIAAFRANENYHKKNILFKYDRNIRNSIKYNAVDCETLFHLMNLLESKIIPV